MICHPESPAVFTPLPDPKQAVSRILSMVDQWNLRAAAVEIKLLIKQCASHADGRRMAEAMATTILDVFHAQNALPTREPASSSPSVEKKRNNRSSTKEQRSDEREARPVTPPVDANPLQFKYALPSHL
jgi:hypothetical protein